MSHILNCRFLYFLSHVAQILRRFRRVCSAIGSAYPSQYSNTCIDYYMIPSDRRILFVSCSATLANPAEYMSKMFALDASEVEVVSNDGAPSGAKDYLIWNPPLVDEMDPSLGRRSSLSEASNLMRFLMKKGFRVILFCKVCSQFMHIDGLSQIYLHISLRYERFANW
jgi:DEAD/DEAH box helicase domain-containing protein